VNPGNPKPGFEDDFVAAWWEFAARASSPAPAGCIAARPQRPKRWVSFGEWQSID